MLTIMRVFMPKHKDAVYGIMIDWCLAQAKYYMDVDAKKSTYWTKRACKYTLKRLNNIKLHLKSFI